MVFWTGRGSSGSGGYSKRDTRDTPYGVLEGDAEDAENKEWKQNRCRAAPGISALRIDSRVDYGIAMIGRVLERRLIVRSRVVEDYHLSELGLKQVQHVFTVWFPRVVFYDLTDDTVRVDVLVKMGRATNKSVYDSSFLRADGSSIKTIYYDEDRMSGRVCEGYDQRRSGYFGKKEGFDYRIVFYTTKSTTIPGR